MATLIKLDNKFINLDNVTEIHSYDLHGWNVIVYYAKSLHELGNGNGNGNGHSNGNGNGHSNGNGNGHSNGNGNGFEMEQQDFEHFTGHEADALREWLDRNATDVLSWYRTQDNHKTLYSREFA